MNLTDRRLVLAFIIIKSEDADDARDRLKSLTKSEKVHQLAEYFAFPEHIIIDLLQNYKEFGKLRATLFLLGMMNERELIKLSILASLNP